jgi:hypothetical protein
MRWRDDHEAEGHAEADPETHAEGDPETDPETDAGRPGADTARPDARSHSHARAGSDADTDSGAAPAERQPRQEELRCLTGIALVRSGG